MLAPKLMPKLMPKLTPKLALNYAGVGVFFFLKPWDLVKKKKIWPRLTT